ncbi:MAG: hypothetical protein RIC06_03340 [Cyclobacteriaceae bacterium]
MKKQLPHLSVLVLFLISVNALAQSDFRNGYIINMENDTIQGLVDYRSNSKNYESCIFKGEQVETVYFPNQILGFGYINDRYYSSQIIEGSFVEVLVTGDINLFKSKNKYHVQKDTSLYHLESKIEVVEIESKKVKKETSRWRGILAFLISDCFQDFNSLTSDIKLNDRGLTQLIVKYNRCRGNNFVEYKANKPWTRFEWGAAFGLSRSEITITKGLGNYSYLANSYSSIDPTLGAVIVLSSPRILESIAFQGEFQIARPSYSSLVVINGTTTEYHDTFIDLTTISIPLSLKYSFPEKKYGWNIQGGINYDYHLKSDARLKSESVSGNVVNTYPESSAFEVNENQIGYWGGIGITRPYNKFTVGFSIRYFQMSTLNKVWGFGADNNKISINLILLRR